VRDQVSHPYKTTGNITFLHESSYNGKKERSPLGKFFKYIAHAHCRSGQGRVAVLALGKQFSYDGPHLCGRPKWPLMWWHAVRQEATEQTAVRNNAQVQW